MSRCAVNGPQRQVTRAGLTSTRCKRSGRDLRFSNAFKRFKFWNAIWMWQVGGRQLEEKVVKSQAITRFWLNSKWTVNFVVRLPAWRSAPSGIQWLDQSWLSKVKGYTGVIGQRKRKSLKKKFKASYFLIYSYVSFCYLKRKTTIVYDVNRKTNNNNKMMISNVKYESLLFTL